MDRALDLDDPAVRAAMRAFVAAADALDAGSEAEVPPRELIDLAEAKAVARMALTRRLLGPAALARG